MSLASEFLSLLLVFTPCSPVKKSGMAPIVYVETALTEFHGWFHVQFYSVELISNGRSTHVVTIIVVRLANPQNLGGVCNDVDVCH